MTDYHPFGAKKLQDFFRYYDPSNPKHVAAVEQLYADLAKDKPKLVSDSANWVRIYRTPIQTEKVLPVPYYSQRDNYRDAARTCFSSSCAMLCKFLKPNSITGDDDYVRTVFSIGDTTDAAVQVQALKRYGITSRFTTTLSFDTLDGLLDENIPVPIGILHHGPSNYPSGGGHWIIVIGKEGDNYVVNDPWGELDDKTGTYISTNGNHLRYSKAMLTRRWTVEGPGTGWALVAQK